MEIKKFTETMKGWVNRIPKIHFQKEQRSLSERRVVFSGIPDGVTQDRREGDDRRLVCTGRKNIFFYPF